MNRRSTVLTTLVLLAGAPVLAACGEQEGDDPNPSPTATSESPSATPEPTDGAFDPAAVDLVGTWRDDVADWTVNFAADGTYTVDFQGNVDFLRGNYERNGAELRLVGLDGNTQVGTITESGLVFDLGTLVKR